MYHMEVGYEIPAPVCKPGVSQASMDTMALAKAKADHDADPDHDHDDDEDMEMAAAVDNSAGLPSASFATSVVLVAAALMA
jgi:hypothetical protein